jgi:hypothetical protein
MTPALSTPFKKPRLAGGAVALKNGGDAIKRRLANVGQWGSGVYAEHVVGFCAGERAISGFAAEAETAPF